MITRIAQRLRVPRPLAGIALLLLALPFPAMAAKPDPAEFNLEVHVRSTELTYACNSSFLGGPSSCGMRLLLVGILDGKRLQLRANTSLLLRTGDYKLKEKKAEGSSTPSYVNETAYELLLPDGKVLTFQVVGESRD